MPTCKYCGTDQVKWRSISKNKYNGSGLRWELWDNIPNKAQRLHDCGHRGEVDCRYCGQPIKLEVITDRRTKWFNSKDIITGEDHRCNWEDIKQLEPWKLPYNWKIKVKCID